MTKNDFPKMNKAIKKKWVAALRSRKFKKGTGCLSATHIMNGKPFEVHCCLGVLCEITGTSFKGHSGIPARTSLKKFGLSTKVADDLACKNDGSGQPMMSFKRIANFIEENL